MDQQDPQRVEVRPVGRSLGIATGIAVLWLVLAAVNALAASWWLVALDLAVAGFFGVQRVLLARTVTAIDDTGIEVRSPVRTRTRSWDEIAGLLLRTPRFLGSAITVTAERGMPLALPGSHVAFEVDGQQVDHAAGERAIIALAQRAGVDVTRS